MFRHDNLHHTPTFPYTEQVTKNILYEKVGGIYDLKAVKSKETRPYQKGKV